MSASAAEFRENSSSAARAASRRPSPGGRSTGSLIESPPYFLMQPGQDDLARGRGHQRLAAQHARGAAIQFLAPQAKTLADDRAGLFQRLELQVRQRRGH